MDIPLQAVNGAFLIDTNPSPLPIRAILAKLVYSKGSPLFRACRRAGPSPWLAQETTRGRLSEWPAAAVKTHASDLDTGIIIWDGQYRDGAGRPEIDDEGRRRRLKSIGCDAYCFDSRQSFLSKAS